MKGIIITALVVLALVAAKGAHANSETDKLCSAAQELAQSIMTARQQGRPLAEMMKIAEGNELTQLLVLEAYRRPAYRAEENRRQAAVDFGNETGLLCYESTRHLNSDKRAGT